MKKKLIAVLVLLVSLVTTVALATHKDSHRGGGGSTECSFTSVPANTIYICEKKWWAGGDTSLAGGSPLELTANTTVSIVSGTMVIWVDKENMPHNVEVKYADGTEYLSPMLQNGDAWTHTFSTGADEFYCDRHANSMAHVPVVVTSP